MKKQINDFGIGTVLDRTIIGIEQCNGSIDVARDLLYACRVGVHWCDGNEYEAMIQMYQMRCGYCLKKMSERDAIYSLYDVSRSFETEHHNEIRAIDIIIADTFLCGECFEKLLDTIAPGVGAEQRKHIEENNSEDCWHYRDWRRPWEKDEKEISDFVN